MENSLLGIIIRVDNLNEAYKHVHRNKGASGVVVFDRENFYDSVHHDKLMWKISKIIKVGDVISLIRKYLVCGIIIDE